MEDTLNQMIADTGNFLLKLNNKKVAQDIARAYDNTDELDLSDEEKADLLEDLKEHVNEEVDRKTRVLRNGKDG